jgi:hypothetical protein
VVENLLDTDPSTSGNAQRPNTMPCSASRHDVTERAARRAAASVAVTVRVARAWRCRSTGAVRGPRSAHSPSVAGVATSATGTS